MLLTLGQATDELKAHVFAAQPVDEGSRLSTNPKWTAWVNSLAPTSWPTYLDAIEKAANQLTPTINAHDDWSFAVDLLLANFARTDPEYLLEIIITRLSDLGEPDVFVRAVSYGGGFIAQRLGINNTIWKSSSLTTSIDHAIDRMSGIVTKFDELSDDCKVEVIDCLVVIGGDRCRKLLQHIETHKFAMSPRVLTEFEQFGVKLFSDRI
ncbi:MAG TPA: hypothetical protein VGK19_17790 [Capsulimonadaceae bacterium]|jgi:hypothetical protein